MLVRNGGKDAYYHGGELNLATTERPSRQAAHKRISAEARREQIVEAAMRLFADKGFNGTTTKEIAEQVGVSDTMVFRYFPTKEDLYSAIIARAAGNVYEETPIIELIRRKDDAGLLRALATDTITRNEKDPSFLRLLYYSGLEGHFLSEMFFQMRVRVRIQALADYIAQRMEDGDFCRVDPTLAAMAFMGMVIQHVIGREIFGQKKFYPASREAAVETFVSIFLSGLKKR
jgi:AcrR family transcriptional regulator